MQKKMSGNFEERYRAYRILLCQREVLQGLIDAPVDWPRLLGAIKLDYPEDGKMYLGGGPKAANKNEEQPV